MEYIIVTDGIITEHLCGGTKPEGAIEVPAGFTGFIGMKLAALKDDLSGIKPISQQVAEGLLTVPEGFKITADDTEIIRMDQEEIDAAFLPEVWAFPGSFFGIRLQKTFDREGNFGYFPPEGAVKMQDVQPTAYHKAEPDGTWTPDVDRARSAKLDEINATYNTATSALVSTYPQTELLTFDKQEHEARAWTTDNAVETPLVDMLAAGRQLDKAELVRRIIAKADAFSVAVGYYTGQRQKYEDMVKAAETAEDIQAIVPEYALPDMIQGAPDATEQPAEDPTTEPTPDPETAPETEDKA